MTVHHRISAIALVVAAIGGAAVWGAGPANAGTVTLQYECTLAPFPAQGMTLQLDWNAPGSVPVGRPTPVIPVQGTATMGDIVTQVLGMVGATTVEGSLVASGVVVAPGGDVPVTLSVTVPRTPVPASGPITIAGSGTTPVFVFHQPGPATITAGSGFSVQITPRDANGDETVAGQIDASCTLDSGQNDVLNSFVITAPKAAPKPRQSPTTRKADPAPAPVQAPTTTAPASSAVGPTNGTTVPPSSADPPAPGSPTSAISAPSDPVAVGPVVRRLSAGRILGVGALLAAGAALVGCVWLLNRRHGPY